jgi:dipeptidyl-peptidase 4
MTYGPIAGRLLLPSLLLLSFMTCGQTKQRYTTLQQALFSGAALTGTPGPRSVNWIDNGTKYAYQDAQGNIRAMDAQTQTETVLFEKKGGPGLAHQFPGTANAFDYESFQFSKDSKFLVFQANFRPVYRRSGVSDYYLYSLADKSLKLIAKDAQTAELSPDGRTVAYERGGDLYTTTLADGRETRLTNDAKPMVYNGRFGWAYEEEFGLAQAWVWSPDSKFIAFWQSDERQVPIYKLTDYKGFTEKYDSLPYPRVGDKNPSVRIGVAELATGKNQWMNVALGRNGEPDGYIPRLYWTSVEGQLGVLHLNRKQNDLTLYMANARTGAAKAVLNQVSDSWLEVYNFTAGIDHLFFFPAGSQEFFWINDRDGRDHLYRYDYSGKLLGQITKGDFEVTIVHSIDPAAKRVIYTSTEASPLERQLYAVNFDGSAKQRLTETAGRHRINMAPGGGYFLDTYSNISLPTQVDLRNLSGKLLKKLVDNTGVTAYLGTHAYAPKELAQFTTADGQRLDISIQKPLDFDPAKKYPVMLDVYGGPGSQSVYNEFETSGWHQWLAQSGYVVVQVNNRGGSAYGRQFMKQVYAKLGKFESLDFAETAKYMATLSYVDGAKLAIRGHSYGGYMSSYTMLTYPGLFKVAIVTAPVTDWRLYDSIYTERYMGLVPQNDAQYKASAVMTYAKNLTGKMLISHSTMDENVHVRNTFQLVNALEDAGKDADLRIYPPGAHGVAYNSATYVLLMTQYTDYLNKHLKGEAVN